MENSSTEPLTDITNQMEMQSNATTTTTSKSVTKRDGKIEPMSREKLTKRLEVLLDGLCKEHINVDAIVTKVIDYT